MSADVKQSAALNKLYAPCFLCTKPKDIPFRGVGVNCSLLLFFQHVIFSVSHLIDMLVPDIPGGLDETIKREAYQAKQIMSEHHGYMGASYSSDDYLLELEA